MKNDDEMRKEVYKLLEDYADYTADKRKHALLLLGWHKDKAEHRCKVCVRAKKPPLARTDASRYLKHIQVIG